MHSERRRLLAPFLLVVSAATSALAIATDGEVANLLHVAIVVVACVAFAGMLAAERRWGGLGIGLVVGAAAMTFAVSLVIVPRFTSDLWSYTMYGRILGVHHVNPWTTPPNAFGHDPILHLVGRTWRGTPSVYGPAFTLLSAAAALLRGGALGARLFYQGLAAVVVAGGGTLIWRRTRSAAAVALLVVHPLILMYVVNGGRNDILVGVAMLAAVVLAARDRPCAAGATAAFGALVKVTGLVGVVALVATMAARGERRAARRTLLAATIVFGTGYAATGTTALFAPMRTAGALYSQGSPWSILPALGIRRPDTHVALAVLAVLVALVVIRYSHSSSASAVAAALSMLCIAAPYTLPGYAAWGLPAAALEHRTRVARLTAAIGLVLLVTYEIFRHPLPGLVGVELHTAAAIAGPAVFLVLAVGLLRAPSTPTPTPTPPSTPTPTEETVPMTLIQPIAAHAPDPAALTTLVVVPTLDEADNIETVLGGIHAQLPGADILVVDDGSTDGTPELADAVGRRLGQIEVLRRHGPRGLGHAYREGFRIALAEHYDAVVEMDADLSHDPRALPALLAAVERGADLAIGSRYVRGGATPGWPARRRALSRAGGWYARTLLRLPVRDTTSGFRVYRAPLLRAIDLDTVTAAGYGFQIEMTLRARQADARIVEVPITFRDRTAGTSKMSGAIAREALVMVTRSALRRGTPRPVETPHLVATRP